MALVLIIASSLLYFDHKYFMFRSYQITHRLSIIVKVIVHGTIFSATQRCNVETMLSLLETMSQRCCNAELRYKSSLRIVSCNITFSETANPQKSEIQPPFLKKKRYLL